MAKPKRYVHNGGIKAVAMATPKITPRYSSFFTLAITKANHQKRQSTTFTNIRSSYVLKTTEDSLLKEKKAKKIRQLKYLGSP